MDKHMKQVLLVFCNTASEGEAKKIARALLADELCACVNISPTQSLYKWDGELVEELEWSLKIKTSMRHYPRLEEKIKALHSYEIPEIIAVKISHGLAEYLQWVIDN